MLTVGIGKVVYSLSKPSIGDFYFPTEVVEVLLSNVEPEHCRAVIKQLSTRKLIPVQFRVVLRHIQQYKEGKKLP
jgi:hypothetical protein